MPKNTPMLEIYEQWAASQGVFEEKVTLWLDTDVLDRHATIDHSNVYDGAIIYGQVNKVQ